MNNKKIWAILKIIIFILIFIYIILRVILHFIKEHVINNWVKYRSNPFIIPIAGLFRRASDKRNFSEATKDHFFSWIWVISKNFFSYLIQPISYVVKIIIKIIHDFTNTLNNFRKQAKVIRKMFAKIVGDTAKKMSNSYTAITFYQAKLVDITNRQKAVFQIALYFAEAMRLTLESLVNGPVIGLAHFFPTYGKMLLILISVCIACTFGGPFIYPFTCPICLVCFEQDTPITMSDLSIKSIKHVGLNEIVRHGGKVTATMVFSLRFKQCNVYNYRGTIVSGSHILITNIGPERIHDNLVAKKIVNNPDRLYCLNTTRQLLDIKGSIYADFSECGSDKYNRIAISLINQQVNSNIIIKKYNYNDYCNEVSYQWCIGKDSQIKMADGNYKAIQFVNLDEVLDGNNRVYGLITFYPSDIIFYNYKGQILSGNQLVFINNKWIRVHKIPNINQIRYPHMIAYHLVTEQHTINILDTVICKDYLELQEDNPVFDKIGEININYIKSKINDDKLLEFKC